MLDEHISHTADITTVAQLEAALTAVAVDLGTTIVASADYATAFALVAQQRMQTNTDDDVATEALEEALAERTAHFADIGLLTVDDPASQRTISVRWPFCSPTTLGRCPRGSSGPDTPDQDRWCSRLHARLCD